MRGEGRGVRVRVRVRVSVLAPLLPMQRGAIGVHCLPPPEGTRAQHDRWWPPPTLAKHHKREATCIRIPTLDPP